MASVGWDTSRSACLNAESHAEPLPATQRVPSASRSSSRAGCGNLSLAADSKQAWKWASSIRLGSNNRSRSTKTAFCQIQRIGVPKIENQQIEGGGSKLPANRTCGPATVQILLHLGHSDWSEGPAGEAPQQANGVGLATDGHFSVLPCERPLEGVRPDRCERPSMHSGAMPNDLEGNGVSRATVAVDPGH